MKQFSVNKSDFASELEKLNNAVKKQNEDSKEEQYVMRLEDLCFSLRCAIVDLSLKFPDLTTFERYLSRLSNTYDLIYIVGLLHRCWVYIYPFCLFDRPMKSRLDIEAALDQALCKYSREGIHGYDFVKEEMEKHNFTILDTIREIQKPEVINKRKSAYREYMKGLYNITNAVCEKKHIRLNEDFTLQEALTTKLTPEQIRAVFDVIVKNGKMSSNEDTRSTFMSIFDSTINVTEGKILWLDVAKSHTPNYSTLYVLFKTMGVEMTNFNKAVICKFFKVKDIDGKEIPIHPEKLKSRKKKSSKEYGEQQTENGESAEQNTQGQTNGDNTSSDKLPKGFEEQIKEAINKHAPQETEEKA